MTSQAHRTHYTWAEYLALEESSNVRHEYLEGQIYGVAGGTPAHAALAAAAIGMLFGQLRGGPCRVYDSDLRIRVLETGLATYSDGAVVCGPLERDPRDEDGVTNPTMVIEVLSKSTEEYDRGDKFEHYKRVPSLRQYVLVSQNVRELEVWTRNGAGDWSRTVAGEGETARLDSIGARLDVDELYDSATAPEP